MIDQYLTQETIEKSDVFWMLKKNFLTHYKRKTMCFQGKHPLSEGKSITARGVRQDILLKCTAFLK